MHLANGVAAVRYEDDPPPKNEVIEDKVNACALIDSNLLDTYVDRVTPEHFASYQNRLISQAIIKVHKSGGVVNIITVAEELNANNLLIDAGGAPKLHELGSTMTSAGFMQYLSSLDDWFRRRQLHYLWREIRRESREPSDSATESNQAFVDRLAAIQAIGTGLSAGRKSFTEMFEAMEAKEFFAAEFKNEFAIKNLLVSRQLCMVIAAKKMLKTSLSLASGIALATGKSLFGQFEVIKPGRVLFVSGESGKATLQETARRICRSNGVVPSQVDITIATRIPQFGSADHMSCLRKFIEDGKYKYVYIDPVFLALGGGAKPINMANLFETGPMIAKIAEMGQELEFTPILLHHKRKNTGKQKGEASDLDDASQSGFAEAARQWWLIDRRSDYEPGTGLHELMLTVGGSAGHNDRFALDINEGTVDENMDGRVWEVTVSTAAAATDRKKRNLSATEQIKQAARREIVRTVIDHLSKHPEGQSIRSISALTGISRDSIKDAMIILQDQGAVAPCRYDSVGADDKVRKTDGFKLINPVNPANVADSNQVQPGWPQQAQRGEHGEPPYKGGASHRHVEQPGSSQTSNLWQSANIKMEF